MRFIRLALALILAGAATTIAGAQSIGTLNPKPLPPLENPDDPKLAAKEIFGRKTTPVPLEARAIGFYAKGCLAGAVALPINGKTWQVMRLSRNRNWGHPQLIELLEKLSGKVNRVARWPGLLVGDISQPRGGPMLTGHSSHQVGLDADIWLTPMPDRMLSREEREEMSATNVVAADKRDVDPAIWTRGHFEVIKAAAEFSAVERIFVNAAIKKALCREAKGDRAWLGKVRPYWGHNYHFHIRLECPKGVEGCQSQPEPGNDDGCGAALDWWFRDAILNPKPAPKPKTPPKPKPPITLADLPPACRAVAVAP